MPPGPRGRQPLLGGHTPAARGGERRAGHRLTTGARRPAGRGAGLADEDVALNRRMGFHGADLVDDGDTILHHCNTGALATVDWGTALGVIFAANEQGKRVHVLVDETRPTPAGRAPDLLGVTAARHFV